jgi:hypothetical protein
MRNSEICCLRLPKGESTHEDRKILLSRQPSNIADLSEFDDAIRLFYSNAMARNEGQSAKCIAGAKIR